MWRRQDLRPRARNNATWNIPACESPVSVATFLALGLPTTHSPATVPANFLPQYGSTYRTRCGWSGRREFGSRRIDSPARTVRCHARRAPSYVESRSNEALASRADAETCMSIGELVVACKAGMAAASAEAELERGRTDSAPTKLATSTAVPNTTLAISFTGPVIARLRARLFASPVGRAVNESRRAGCSTR